MQVIAISPIFEQAMKHWAPRQLITLILGAMFALGTVVSAVQAADMAVEMSTGAVMGAAMAPDGCGGACGGDDEAAGTGSCVMACPTSFQAIVPAAGPVVLTDATAMRPLGEFASAGRSSHPDPYPPKPANLI